MPQYPLQVDFIQQENLNEINYQPQTIASQQNMDYSSPLPIHRMDSLLNYCQDGSQGQLDRRDMTNSQNFNKNLLSQGLHQQYNISNQNINKKGNNLNNNQKKSSWGFIHHMQLVRTFIRIMKKATNFRLNQKLTKIHYEAISDKSSYFDSSIVILNNKKSTLQKSKRFCQIITQKLELFIQIFCQLVMTIIYCIGSKIKVIAPNSQINICWIHLNFLINIIILLLVPIIGIFGIQIYSETLFLLQSFLLIEVFYKFNVGIIVEGQIEMNRVQIGKKYLKLQFWLDLISNFLFNIIIYQYSLLGILPYVIVLLRILNLNKQWTFLDDYYQISYKFPTIMVLFRLFILIFWLGHLSSCSFIAVGNFSVNQGEESWLIKNDLIGASNLKIYIKGLYFSFITMITVGYGDITPISIYETVYVIIMTMLSTMIFGYSVNTIGTIFSDISKKNALFQQQKFDLQQYLDVRKVNSNIQYKLLKYLDYINFKRSNDPQKGSEIIKIFSDNLKDEVYSDYYGKILSQIPFIKQNFSEKFIKELSKVMEEKCYSPGEIIARQGELNSQLYFIYSGAVDIILEQNNQSVCIGKLKEKDSYGYENFFLNQVNDTSIKSEQFTLVTYIALQKFLMILQKFPSDYERFCQIKEQIVINRQAHSIQCKSCGEYDHYIQQCPLYFYKPNKWLLSSKNIMSYPQIRKKYQRKTFQTNCILNSSVVKNKLKQYKINLLLTEKEIDEEMLKELHTDKQFYQATGKIQLNGLNQIQIVDTDNSDDNSEDNDNDISDDNISLEEEKDQCLIQKQNYLTKRNTQFLIATPQVNYNKRMSTLDALQMQPQKIQQTKNRISLIVTNVDQNNSFNNSKSNSINIQSLISDTTSEAMQDNKNLLNPQQLAFQNEKRQQQLKQKSIISQDNQINQQNQFYQINNFDQLKIYKFFFPHNNYPIIIKQANKLKLKRHSQEKLPQKIIKQFNMKQYKRSNNQNQIQIYTDK